MTGTAGAEVLEAALLDLDGTLIKFARNYEHFLRRIARSVEIHDAEDPFFAAYGA